MPSINRAAQSSSYGPSGGSVPWINVGNIAGPGFTRPQLLSAGLSRNIRGRSFGFSIPTGATIDGIAVNGAGSESFSGASSNSILRLIKTSAYVGQNKPTGGFNGVWSGAAGGATDLWGTTWTAADINSSNFGPGCQFSNSGSGVFTLFGLSVTVYYTDPPNSGDGVVSLPLTVAGAATVTSPSVRGGRVFPEDDAPRRVFQTRTARVVFSDDIE